jgi:hypothetical protein
MMYNVKNQLIANFLLQGQHFKVVPIAKCKKNASDL